MGTPKGQPPPGIQVNFAGIYVLQAAQTGLAWMLIFGPLASTVFTLFVIPVTYYILFANKPGHGVPVMQE